MKLFKVSFLGLISTFFKMLSNLVINKVIAMYIGPSGLAVIANFRDFSQMALTAGRGAINTGVTKYASEYKSSPNSFKSLLGTAGVVSLWSSGFIGLLLIVFSSQLSEQFLQDSSYYFVFVLFGFTLVLFVANNLILSLLNGIKEIKTFISINVFQSLFSLFYTSALIYFIGLKGALIALVTNQSIVFVLVLGLLRKYEWIRFKSFIRNYDKKIASKLLRFSLMTLVTALTVPVSHLLVRNFISGQLDLDAAGNWQGVMYVSTMYLMVITTTLNIYFLPRLSELTEKADLRSELVSGYKLIVPVVLLMSLGIYVFRELIIKLLFATAFQDMRDLFFWQLLGDVFKICGAILGFLLVAKARTTRVIIVNSLFSLLFVLFSYLFFQWFNLKGIVVAHFVNHVLFFGFMLFITRDLLYETKG